MLPLAWPLSLGTRLVFRKTCAFNYVAWFVRPVLLLECRWIPVYLYGSSRFFTGVSQLSQLSQLAFVQLWPWLLVLTGYFYGIIHSINVFFSTYNWYIKDHDCKFYHVCLGFYMVFRWFLYGFLGFPMVFRWFYFEPQLHLLFFLIEPQQQSSILDSWDRGHGYTGGELRCAAEMTGRSFMGRSYPYYMVILLVKMVISW